MFKNYGTLNFLEDGFIAKEISNGIFKCYECSETYDGGMYELKEYYVNVNVNSLDLINNKRTKEEILLDICYGCNTDKFSNIQYYTDDEIYEIFKDEVPGDITFDSYAPNYQ